MSYSRAAGLVTQTVDVDGADLESKSTFTPLTELFALQSDVAIGDAPVLTLPVRS